MVDGSSHSAWASDAADASGFSLYARPIRIPNQNTKREWDAQDAREKNRPSNFVVDDARGFLFVVGDVDLEVGEQRAGFALQEPQHRDRHAPDFQLGSLAAAQLEHRAPGARVAGHDDLQDRKSTR